MLIGRVWFTFGDCLLGSCRLFGSLKDIQLELEQVEIMEWKMFSV